MRILFFAALSIFLNISNVNALLKVQVNRGIFSPIPIAIADFVDNDSDLGKNIRQIIASDLGSSGLFRAVPKDAYIQDCESLNKAVRFSDWRLIKVDGLVYGDVKESGGQIVVTFKLVDVFSEKQMLALQMQSSKTDWRKLAHVISNAIYERLTGEKGYFTTKVAYVSETGRADRRVKRLAIMDYDGENHRYLTTGRTFVMTPRFSPDGNKIAYFTIINHQGNVYIYDINNHTTELLGRFKGMSYAPRFSADGKSILFSVAEGMTSHIFEMDLKTRTKRQLTKVPALNTSPYYSPDGSKIAFVSDRSSTPQIYIMERNGEFGGESAKRITYGQGRYYTPVFSPNGQHLAFTKTYMGTFYVGVLRPDGTSERTLAQGFFVEAPTWSPNSQMVMYTRRTQINPNTKSEVARVYSIHVSGFNEREILTPLDATDPEWSNSF
ncbi:MAG: Tol-Pal system protein TolB [Candidatus Paracaedibacteraceae bacterium]|nr:Tol-Pal system protein TolB [Candidatus Paracaedibacteraceae bacterium]